jgi:Ser/Thr protein kinase RdoA (MazF antagonist)
MQALAEKAVRSWPLRVNSIALAAHRENAVFKVDAVEGSFALRLHRPGYRLTSELISELHMMAMLEGHDIAVPRPLKATIGSYLQEIDGTQISVLSWLSGRPLGRTGEPLALKDRFGTFYRLGEVLAEMHGAFDAWQAPQRFTRPRWDADGLMGDHPTWGRFWDNPMLTAEEKKLLIQTRMFVQGRLARHAFDFGLIHADLVSENLLVDDAAVALIDFDDSGFGFRLQDLATALVKHQQEPDYVDLRRALLDGYSKRQTVNVEDVDLFLLIRHLSYVGWIADRMTDEKSRERSRLFIDQATQSSQRFLNSL